MKHDFETIRFIPPSGRENAYLGRRCRKCGVRTYAFYNMIRWRYPDSRVHDNFTVDEPYCHPLPEEDEREEFERRYGNGR